MTDTRKIAAAFHDCAAEYDRNITVQKRVVKNLAGHIENHLAKAPGAILDVGSGTGSLLKSLGRIYPGALLCGADLAFNMCLQTAAKAGDGCLAVNANAEMLPFRSGAFDLVVSASALQWVGNLAGAIHEFRRVLKPGGAMSIAFFCDGTLGELQRCLRDAAGGGSGESTAPTARLHRFRTVDDVRSILAGMDFEQVLLGSESETEWHDDVTALLRSIRSIGAGPVTGGSAAGLGWRGIIGRTSELYRERYGQDGRIPATYEVLYLNARAPMATARQRSSGPAD